MKKLTIIISICFFLVFTGMVIYVAVSEDFVEPKSLQEQGDISADNPIWNKKMDDLAQYLADNDMIQDAKNYGLLSDGVGTEARLYDNIELYWWDIENLAEGTAEYKAYTEAVENGNIDLWSSGNIMQVEVYGPFAVNASRYEGDIKKLTSLLYDYVSEKTDSDKSEVWNKSLEDLEEYLTAENLMDKTKKAEVTSEGYTSAAFNYSGVELYWWDLENLDTGSDEYKAYLSLKEEGFIDLWGSGNIISPVLNGPFALNILNGYNGDVNKLNEAFKEFGHSS
ncbi:hypothetical protein [Scatolibacter rhodanostii]|uniref:hypothetical protein n=1 Tax=Scatolibacter rhodanostii TaxID=2014781 RepID=UPI000C086887|nr:hypothetical protein [Scatolibacter rhodanostii]